MQSPSLHAVQLNKLRENTMTTIAPIPAHTFNGESRPLSPSPESNIMRWADVCDLPPAPPFEEPVILPTLPPCRCEGSITDRTASLRDKISTATSFRELCPYARMAHPHVSLLGRRYVSVEGYKGAVDINAFPQRMLELIKQNPHFDEEERSHGKTIATKINRLYHHSEELLLGSYLLTRVLGSLVGRIRIFFAHFQTEYYWINRHDKRVNLYTKTQYREAFGIEKKSDTLCNINDTKFHDPYSLNDAISLVGDLL
jgi:hypothetical protein